MCVRFQPHSHTHTLTHFHQRKKSAETNPDIEGFVRVLEETQTESPPPGPTHNEPSASPIALGMGSEPFGPANANFEPLSPESNFLGEEHFSSSQYRNYGRNINSEDDDEVHTFKDNLLNINHMPHDLP